MAYKDYVKNLWETEFVNQKSIDESVINKLRTAWTEIKKDFNEEGGLKYYQIDMKQVKPEIPGSEKDYSEPCYKETIEKWPGLFNKETFKSEKENIYKLATYIDQSKAKQTFGRRLREIENGNVLCGKNVEYSVAFGIAVKYDVIESYKKICANNAVYGYSRDKECDWETVLGGKEETDWLVSYPVTEPGNSERDSKLDEDSEDFKKRLSTANEVIQKLCKVQTISDIEIIQEEIKKIGKSFSGSYVRACLLQSIEDEKVKEDEDGIEVEDIAGEKDLKIHNSLLFQNLPKANFIAFYDRTKEEVDDKKYETWASQSNYIIDKLYELTEADKSVPNTFKLGALAWKLTLDSDFTDIDNPDYKQVVYTGAPGTGKTFGITEYVKQACLINPMKKDVAEASVSDKDFTQWKFVQFHSSYDYSDFVEGLRPVQLQEGQNPTFVRMDGIFKSFCRSVVEYNNAYNIYLKKEINKDLNEGEEEKEIDPNESAEETTSFYFIIDEINRADIGKVFGELMYGLEESYRGAEHPISTQYMNLDTYIKNNEAKKDCAQPAANQTSEENKAGVLTADKYIPLIGEADVFYKGFYIPENVRIIGSMNDIDRSVETFDFALRRRFQWKNIEANDKDRLHSVLESMFIKYKGAESRESEQKKYDEAINNLDDLIDNHIIPLNNVISGERKGDINGTDYGLGKEYQLGPAYFKKYRGDDASLKFIWEDNIEPILKEYIRGRDNEGAFIDYCRSVFLAVKPNND